MPVHAGIGFDMSGAATSAAKDGMGSAEASVGATELTFVINSSGTLDSYVIKAPLSMRMSATQDVGGSIVKKITMDTSICGTTDISYTFTR